MTSSAIAYTIYPGAYDPARGKRPDMVGIALKPTISGVTTVTKPELLRLIAELQAVANKMN